jgi:hypothetical protein
MAVQSNSPGPEPIHVHTYPYSFNRDLRQNPGVSVNGSGYDSSL